MTLNRGYKAEFDVFRDRAAYNGAVFLCRLPGDRDKNMNTEPNFAVLYSRNAITKPFVENPARSKLCVMRIQSQILLFFEQHLARANAAYREHMARAVPENALHIHSELL